MEILNLFFTISILILLNFFSFFLILKKKNINLKINLIDTLGSNYIILLNCILFFSFFNPDKNFLFIILMLISFFSLIFFFRQKIKINNKIIFIFFILLIILISIDIASNFDFSWDTKKYYLHKATAFYQNFFVNDLFKKTEYPHFPTYLWAFFWKNSFLNYEYIGRLTYGYTFVLSIFYFTNSLKLSDSYKILTAIIIFLTIYKQELFDGRPDILMFSFFLFIARNFYELFHNKNQSFHNIFIIFLTLNLILWTKSEGVAYVIIFAITIFFFLKTNFNKKIIFLLGVVFLIFIKLLFYHYYDLSLNPNEETFKLNIFEKFNLLFLLERTLQIFSWYAIYFIANPIIIITSGFFIIILFNFKAILNNFKYLYFFFILKFMVIYGTFLITAYPMPFHLKYSLDRIILHSSGLWLIIAVYLANNLYKNKKLKFKKIKLNFL
jgi:hypothetical protein